MKKIIFAAITAIALAVPATLRADEPAKEYNMVITLQNGTTITLGHNDIKNITFNGEEISISGNAADTIEELSKANDDTRSYINDIINRLSDYASQAYVLQIVDDLKDYIERNSADLDTVRMLLEQEFANVFTRVEDNSGRIVSLETAVVANKSKIEDLSQKTDFTTYMNEIQEERISTLEEYAKHLESLIEQIKEKLGL